MKTTDLAPGVIYAEQTRSYGPPTAIMLIDATTPVRFTRSSGWSDRPRALVRDAESAPSARAYLAISATSHEELAEAAPKIAKLTIDTLTGELKAVEKEVPEGLTLTIVRPRDIKSTWDDHVAFEQREQEARERAEVRRAEEAASRKRQEAALTDALQARGISAGRWTGDVQLDAGTAKMSYDMLFSLLGIEPVK